ncbi:MAG: EAL domain-containing protein [Rhodocyclaceae bacterium]|nr:EAL domain-containing protein [Rhodocyclaceae bacterium]
MNVVDPMVAGSFTCPMPPPAPERLLIVEDEPRLRESCAALLSREGREIIQCGSGKEALARLAEHDIDVVLLDLNLPDIGGIEVLNRLHNPPSAASIIVVSADNQIDSAIQALRHGASEFIRKPYKPEHLERTVDNALRRRRLERSHAFMTSRLEQSEQLHRFLVEESPDIIYTLDDEGRFKFISGRVETLLGFPSKDLIGQHYSMLVTEDDREKAHYAFNERRTGERASSNVEIRLQRMDGNGCRHFDNRFIVTMLSAAGLYDGGEGNHPQRYVGTYGVARDITDRKRADEVVSFHAYHDQLTSLPNRTLFSDRLELALRHASRNKTLVAVLFVDLDRFKLVNDTYGHAEGDRMLKSFAERLSGLLRSADTLARQGGDEFTIILPDLARTEDAAFIADKIVDAMRKPFSVAGQDFVASVSIGIAVYPRDGETTEALMRHADLAMYSVKNSGKNAFAFFTAEMSQGQGDRIALENDLRRAGERGELELVYQPQVSAAQRRMLGVEALLRWHHPTHGLIDPPRFLALAEDAGFIHLVSDWVLDEACRQIARWHSAEHRGLRMSVNLSPREFERDDIVDRVTAAMEAHGLPAETLEVEITENLLLHDVERVIDKVRTLRHRGVRVAIDDFGTRYSSLNYLRQFPVSSIKIDQSFIHSLGNDVGAAAIVSAFIGIARGFDLQLVAEGVETDVQVASLRSLGCDTMQGYHFARPLAAAAVNEMLVEYPATVS